MSASSVEIDIELAERVESNLGVRSVQGQTSPLSARDKTHGCHSQSELQDSQLQFSIECTEEVPLGKHVLVVLDSPLTVR